MKKNIDTGPESGRVARKSDVISARKHALEFRQKWLSVIKDVSVRPLEFNPDRGKKRCVYLVHDQGDLIDQFERERMALDSRIEKIFKGIGQRRHTTVWIPTLIRRCSRLHLKRSAAHSQRELNLPQARSAARKVESRLNDDASAYVERRSSGNRYALAVSARDVIGGPRRRYEMPFTEWAVVECVGMPKRDGNNLTEEPRCVRASDETDTDNWAARRKAQLVVSHGASKIYAVDKAAPRVSIDFDDNDIDGSAFEY